MSRISPLLTTVDSENFVRILFSRNCIKRHISDVNNLRLRQDLPISINDRVILPFREGFIFMKLRICICEVSRKFSLRKNFRIYIILIKIYEKLKNFFEI